ncbi:MAG: Rieske 2Fe-2S domain-containing protein, partial [Marmoricola sp.]|nr:Rieske 2Fe-2S domain-containing protein [Marmoricola sp.]
MSSSTVPSKANKPDTGSEARSTAARSLDHGTAPERFARGWHCLGPVGQFEDGKPHAIEAFGGKLVVWQGANGDLNVLDGYCRHMGGDLTQGTVKGDEIACPFHDWRWGGDGKCKAIPYARRIPLRARTQKYETVVRNGLLMVWHDHEGSAADHEVLPPELDDIMDPQKYTDWSWNVLDVPSAHCRE